MQRTRDQIHGSHGDNGLEEGYITRTITRDVIAEVTSADAIVDDGAGRAQQRVEVVVGGDTRWQVDGDTVGVEGLAAGLSVSLGVGFGAGLTLRVAVCEVAVVVGYLGDLEGTIVRDLVRGYGCAIVVGALDGGFVE